MSQIKLTGIPSHIPKEHQKTAQDLFALLDWRTQKTIAKNYGHDHNTLVATVRRTNGKEEAIPFRFRENTLKSPDIVKYNARDLALVQLLGWHIFPKGTYGNFVYNPNFSYTLNEGNVLRSAQVNDLEHINGNCILALKSQGVKANPEETLAGEESTCDGSMFLFSPYSASKGSTAFFYGGRHNFSELSDGAQFLGCNKVQAYSSPDLRALLDKNLKIANCPNTDILKTGDNSKTLAFNNEPGVTIENGNQLSRLTRFYRYVWKWDQHPDNQIKVFLEGKQVGTTTATSSPENQPASAPTSKSKKL